MHIETRDWNRGRKFVHVEMDPNHKKLKTLLTNTVLQFCRQNGCFEDELRIQGTVCVTSDSCSFFVTQLSEIFNFTDEERNDVVAERAALSPVEPEQNVNKSSSPSPVGEHKNRRWLKRKALHQPGVTSLKKVKTTVPTTNENELGIVKIEHDACSPLEDSNQESADSASTSHGNSFLGFGDEIVRHPVLQGYTPNKKDAPLLVSGELVRGDLPVEYSYNQAEFIAAMNRDVAGVINPEPADDLNTTVNKTKEPTNYLQHVEKKEADKYRCTICGKEYSNRGSIYRHIDKHLGRSFSCDYCGSTFESHSGWTRHIRTIHAQHMNFSCDKCPQKFYQKNALEQHYTRIHSKEEAKGETSEQQQFQSVKPESS